MDIAPTITAEDRQFRKKLVDEYTTAYNALDESTFYTSGEIEFKIIGASRIRSDLQTIFDSNSICANVGKIVYPQDEKIEFLIKMQFWYNRIEFEAYRLVAINYYDPEVLRLIDQVMAKYADGFARPQIHLSLNFSNAVIGRLILEDAATNATSVDTFNNFISAIFDNKYIQEGSLKIELNMHDYFVNRANIISKTDFPYICYIVNGDGSNNNDDFDTLQTVDSRTTTLMIVVPDYITSDYTIDLSGANDLREVTILTSTAAPHNVSFIISNKLHLRRLSVHGPFWFIYNVLRGLVDAGLTSVHSLRFRPIYPTGPNGPVNDTRVIFSLVALSYSLQPIKFNVYDADYGGGPNLQLFSTFARHDVPHSIKLLNIPIDLDEETLATLKDRPLKLLRGIKSDVTMGRILEIFARNTTIECIEDFSMPWSSFDYQAHSHWAAITINNRKRNKTLLYQLKNPTGLRKYVQMHERQHVYIGPSSFTNMFIDIMHRHILGDSARR